MPPRSKPLFVGDRVRALRRARGLSQGTLSTRLGISVSYLSQIESGERPLTPPVLKALAFHFPSEWAQLDPSDASRFLNEALEAACDPSVADALDAEDVHRTLERNPLLARRFASLHAAYRQSQDQLRVLDDRFEIGRSSQSQLPWEQVRDWFHVNQNYIDALDRQAEAIVENLGTEPYAASLERLLFDRYGVRVASEPSALDSSTLRSFDADRRLLRLNALQTRETQNFQIAWQFASLAFAETIAGIAGSIGPARDLLASGLTNYAAGALLMPYRRFREAAMAVRTDVERLRRTFATSFEQTCHRLSNLQRPELPGIPVFFFRIDMAGNITKRHSATPLQFARFGGACPLWIVHEAAAIPDRILVQLAETPDGIRYISMAKGLVKPSRSFADEPRRFAVALGCEAEHAGSFVYADAVRTGGLATRIGVSCRICPREACDHRAYPPAAVPVSFSRDRRGVVPYEF